VTNHKQNGQWIYHTEKQWCALKSILVQNDSHTRALVLADWNGQTPQILTRTAAELSVKGVIKGNLKTESGKATTEEIYIVWNLKELLLGRPAIEALNLVQKVETFHSDDSTKIEPEGCLKVWESWKENLHQVEAWFNTLHDYNTKTCSTTSHAEGQRRATENGNRWCHFKSSHTNWLLCRHACCSQAWWENWHVSI